MTHRSRSLKRLVSVLVQTLTLACSVAYLVAQSTPPSGSYGSLIIRRFPRRPPTADWPALA